MEIYMTPERTANAIMQDSTFKGYYLVVEGKKDVKIYGKFINENRVRIKPAFGNERVKRVLEILDERGFENRAGIIDSDFKKLFNISENINGLFITDDHDIEVMIIKTEALEAVINIHCSKSNIKEFEEKQNTTIRDAILTLGKEIGYLKYANQIYDLGLVFKPKLPEGNQIKYSNFTCDKTLNFLGEDKLIETALNYSRGKSTSLKDKNTIKEKLKEVSKDEVDLMQLVNGHDLSNFLYILMKKVLKSRTRMLNDVNGVEDSLILAYEFSYFKETELYFQLMGWAKNNGITILKN